MRLARPRSALLASFWVSSESSKPSIWCSTASESLNPSGPNSLMPLSANGLCEAEIMTHGAREHSNRRGRDRTGQQDVHADRGETGNECRLDHVARQPGILADEHAVAMVATAKHEPGRLPDLESELRRDHAVRAAANTVGTEVFTNHVVLDPVHTRSF